MKTHYRYNKNKDFYPTNVVVSKWKSPLALSLSILAFVILWKLTSLLMPFHWTAEDQEWNESEQVTLDVALPESEVQTSLIQPSNLNTLTQIDDQAEWRTFTIKSGDNLASYFQQAGVDLATVQEVLAIKEAHYLKKIFPGQILKIQAHSDGSLQSLQFDIDPLTTLHITRQENEKLIAKIAQKPIEKRVAFGGGAIVDSFFVAGKNAKLDDAMIMELANVFAYDIDFAQDIKPNDYFKVLYEEYFVNGVKVGNGPIVAAEFVNDGQAYQAVRYTDRNQQSSYYTPSGQSLKKAFIRTPVQFSRISSPFNMHRFHPVLHKIRAHRGVDYAAPTGTPVKAVGQGKVIFAGKKGGYGNTIVVQHGPKYTTLYAHLSRFAKQLKTGAGIRQGQIIGYVGSTGLASGPHLHFEFQINGVHHNPLTVPLPMAEGITGKAKQTFLAYSRELLRLMDQHEKIQIAANEF